MATIQGIYLALFGRPADPAGLAYFNAETNNGADLTAIGDLAATDEYQDRFEGQTDTQVINSIYQSLFGRDADPAGLAFSLAALEDGTYDINNIAIAILDGARNEDLATLNAKLSAANLFTASLDLEVEVDAYVGDAAADIGRAFIADVDANDPGTQAEADAAIDLLLGGGGQGPGNGGGDQTAPTLNIDVADFAVDEEGSTTVTFTFSEAVQGFTASDISAANGSVSNLTFVSPGVYTATYTANAGFEGQDVISVAAGAYSDAAGNAGAGDSQRLTVSDNDVLLYDEEGTLVFATDDLQAAIDFAGDIVGGAVGYTIGTKNPAAFEGDITLDVDGLTVYGYGQTLNGGAYITGAGARLEGWTINGTLDNPTAEGASVFIQADDVAIVNNVIEGDAVGNDGDLGIVSTGGLSGLVITGNEVNDFEAGIYLNPADEGAVVSGNVFSGNVEAVIAEINSIAEANNNTFDDAGTDVRLSLREAITFDFSEVLASGNTFGAERIVEFRLTEGSTFTGTDGNDIIHVRYGTGAADTHTGGEGDDTFVYSTAGGSTEAAMDTITDFTVGEDIIDIRDIPPGTSHSPWMVHYGDADFTSYAEVRAAAIESIDGPDNFPFVGSDGVDTWVFIDTSHDGFDAGDTVIKLAGVTDATTITNASFLFPGGGDI